MGLTGAAPTRPVLARPGALCRDSGIHLAAHLGMTVACFRAGRSGPPRPATAPSPGPSLQTRRLQGMTRTQPVLDLKRCVLRAGTGAHFPSLQVGSPQGQAGTLKCSEERVRLCPWTEAWSCCPPMSMVGVVWPRHMGSTQDLSQYHAVPFSQPTYGSTCRALCVTPGACMPQGHPL